MSPNVYLKANTNAKDKMFCTTPTTNTTSNTTTNTNMNEGIHRSFPPVGLTGLLPSAIAFLRWTRGIASLVHIITRTGRRIDNCSLGEEFAGIYDGNDDVFPDLGGDAEEGHAMYLELLRERNDPSYRLMMKLREEQRKKGMKDKKDTEHTDYIGCLRGGGSPEAESDSSYKEEDDKGGDQEADVEAGGRKSGMSSSISSTCPYPSPPTQEERGRRSGAPSPCPASCPYPSPPEQRGRRSGAPSPSPPGSSSGSSPGSSSPTSSQSSESSQSSSSDEDLSEEEEVSPEEIEADMRERGRRSGAPSPSSSRFPSQSPEPGGGRNPANDQAGFLDGGHVIM